MAKLLKMLWEYMDLTVLPFFETWSAHIFWGGRGCAGALTRPSTRHLLPKNFEKTALRKRWGIFTVKMRGGHIYGNYCTGLINEDERDSNININIIIVVVGRRKGGGRRIVLRNVSWPRHWKVMGVNPWRTCTFNPCLPPHTPFSPLPPSPSLTT